MEYRDYLRKMWDVKEQVKERLRGRRARMLQSRHRKGAANAASMATSFAAARVFKGNVVLARMGHSLASRAAKDRWQLHVGGVGGGAGRTVMHSTSQTGSHSVAGPFKRLQALPSGGSAAHDVESRQAVSPRSSALSQATPETCNSVDGRTGVRTKEKKEKVVMPMKEVHVEDRQGAGLTLAQAVAVPLLGHVCHVFMHGLNRTEVHGAEKLQVALSERPKGQPLITVCNHVAAMDDPLVLAAIVPPQQMLHAPSMRWTLCATDRCFKGPAMSAFFKAVKVLPVVRGLGVDQKGMDVAVAKLARGDWVHIFPEGSRSRDGGKTLGSMKRGIGRLVVEPQQVPMVVPFVHAGMHEVLGLGKKLPSVGQTVVVLVGDPVEVDDLVALHREQGLSQEGVYDAISARVGARMQALKEEVDALVAARQLQALQQQEAAAEGDAGGQHKADWGKHLWQRAEWEALGDAVPHRGLWLSQEALTGGDQLLRSKDMEEKVAEEGLGAFVDLRHIKESGTGGTGPQSTHPVPSLDCAVQVAAEDGLGSREHPAMAQQVELEGGGSSALGSSEADVVKIAPAGQELVIQDSPQGDGLLIDSRFQSGRPWREGQNIAPAWEVDKWWLASVDGGAQLGFAAKALLQEPKSRAFAHFSIPWAGDRGRYWSQRMPPGTGHVAEQETLLGLSGGSGGNFASRENWIRTRAAWNLLRQEGSHLFGARKD